MRPLHCTRLGLPTEISQNLGNLGAQFLVVGVCVRAAPEEGIEMKCVFCQNNSSFHFCLYHQLFFLCSVVIIISTETHAMGAR